MDVVIKGKNLVVTEALRDYAQKKLERALLHVDGVQDAQLELSIIRNPSVSDNQIAEVTLHANGTVIRGESVSQNMYASIDEVADKIERQIRRYHDRLRARGRHAPKTSVVVAEPETQTLLEEAEAQRIVRKKVHPVKPLTPEEAAHQMDLLGHDFYVFVNEESHQVNVLYHRKDGHYGLIEPS